MTGREELVVLSRKEYERLIEVKKENVKADKREAITEENVLRWSREAKKLKKAGKLPLLNSLKEFR